MQENNMSDKTKFHQGLKFMDLAYDDSKVYFLNYNRNERVRLWNYDFENKKLNFLIDIPKSDKEQKWASHMYLTKKEDCLYLLPFDSNFIYVYDIKKRIFIGTEKITLNSYKNEKWYGKSLFYEGFLYDKYIFAASLHGTIMRYDTTNGNISFYDEWYKKLAKENNININKTLFYDGILKKDDSLFIAITNQNINVVVEFNMKNCVSELHYIGDKKNEYISIECDDKNYWLLDNKNKQILFWNRQNSIIKEYNLPIEKSKSVICSRLILYSDRYIGIEICDYLTEHSYVLWFDIIEENFKKKLKDFYDMDYKNYLVMIKKINNIFILFSMNLQKFYRIDYKKSFVNEYVLTENQLKEVDAKRFGDVDTPYWIENHLLDISLFIDYATNNLVVERQYKSVGQNILEVLRGE